MQITRILRLGGYFSRCIRRSRQRPNAMRSNLPSSAQCVCRDASFRGFHSFPLTDIGHSSHPSSDSTNKASASRTICFCPTESSERPDCSNIPVCPWTNSNGSSNLLAVKVASALHEHGRGSIRSGWRSEVIRRLHPCFRKRTCCVETTEAVWRFK